MKTLTSISTWHDADYEKPKRGNYVHVIVQHTSGFYSQDDYWYDELGQWYTPYTNGLATIDDSFVVIAWAYYPNVLDVINAIECRGDE